MKFISHRGNINKIIKKEENKPDKILFCLEQGYDVEIDVWNIKNKFYLGHDEPQYFIKQNFLLKKGLWCHAKNLYALKKMSNMNTINYFWHENDDYTLTSQNKIWVFPNKPLIKNCIAVLPEKSNYKIDKLNLCFGICSDIIENYKKMDF